MARKLGSALITKTMSRRYQIDMKSYDRLFPNQDTLPKGGFGNLIALPFQKEAMLRGNSVFINDEGLPYSDQWAFLSSVKRMCYREVETFVDESVRTGQVLAVRHSPVEEDDEPWMRLPSGKKRFKVEIKELPKTLNAVLKERVQALPKDRLAKILLSLAEKYPDSQRDLLVEMGDDPQEATSLIHKQIHQIFRAFESDDYASTKKELNEYGMNDEPLEGLAIETLD